ncbi:hypothetical protein BKA63DRAFT_272211 [Paraphoma chrysanthemicola]|nr:hypothetical protein BKA63DRAFT_272211 [Paraphoma chrysanthemicola]
MAGVNSGSSLVRFIERHPFFRRPKQERRQLLACSEQAKLPDYSTRVSTCRTKAAGSCQTPDVGITWTGDACVCSTLGGYASKFANCIGDTPYSSCYNSANNNAAYFSWSTDHCKSSSSPKPASSSPKPVTPPTSSQIPTPTPSPAPAPTPKPAPSSEAAPKPTSNPEPPKTPDAPVKTNTITQTVQSIPSSVPELSLVTVVVAAPTSSIPGNVDASTTPSASRIPLARWNGNGAILNGYCATPEYAIINGPTAYWAPVVGCVRSKSDCCPFDIASPTAVGAAAAVDTGVPAFGGASDSNGGFPSAVSPAQATLSKCPSDYHSIGNGCCPSNYFPWTTALGGQTPCYSTLASAMTPPPISANIPSNPSTPTSAIVNVVYAMQYPLVAPTPVPKSGLQTSAKIGIGAGAGVAALIFGLLTFLLLRKHRAHKKDKAALDQMSGIGSTRQSVASNSYGGVKAWQKKVAVSEVSSGLEPVPEQEPTLPNVAVPQPQYPAEWRPGQRTVSPPVPVPHPGYYQRSSLPSPPIPEHGVYGEKVYSEMGSDGGFTDGRAARSELSGEYTHRQGNASPTVWGEEVGGGNGRRSELSGEYQVSRPDLQSQYQGGYGDSAQGEWQHVGVAQPVRYYEAPAGRAMPRVG